MNPRPLPATALARNRRILVLYDHHWLHVKTIADYLAAFRRYSHHEVYYATSFGPCPFDLDTFDAVVIHYSVKVCYPGHLSPSYERALRRATCTKVLFIQDEYEGTLANHRAILDLGIHTVFTCVPEASIDSVYPHARFPGVDFVSTLTGFVPEDFAAIRPVPLRERSTLIGYRGRNLGYWYGDLGQEKVAIGRTMRTLCDARGLKTDIEWEEEHRIYGDDWLRFLGSARATLGTESGSNVFDFDGSLALAIQRELLTNPAVTYDDIRERYLSGIDGTIDMAQISPKIFEAIACRTALILFEGRYSGILAPDEHFIPLRKDFANFDDVLRRVQDDDHLEALTTRAFDHVIASGRYSYRAFVQRFDEVLAKRLPSPVASAHQDLAWLPTPPCDTLVSFKNRYLRTHRGPLLKRLWASLPGPLRAGLRPFLSRHRWKKRWILLPDGVRSVLDPVLKHARGILKSG